MRKNRNSEPYVVRKYDKFYWCASEFCICIICLSIMFLIYSAIIGGFSITKNLIYVCSVVVVSSVVQLATMVSLKNKENELLVCVNEKGLYLRSADTEKPTQIMWYQINKMYIGKNHSLEIVLKTGVKISFNFYSIIMNLYRFRRAVRYFSGRDDLLKTNGPLWMNM